VIPRFRLSKLQAFLVACFARVGRKKESGPEGRSLGSGIEIQQKDVKIDQLGT
jgi:hypothetical protein